MTLINFTLLPGLLLALVPVILHLVMRAKPKRMEFPALRLIKARQPSNARRLQLKHLLLLLLRALLILIFVLAIVRPSLPAARYSLRWWEWMTMVAAAAGSTGVYFWLTRRHRGRVTLSSEARERQTRLRLWCLLAGLLAVLIGTGLPWGLRVRGELLAPGNEAMENIPVAAVFLIDTSISMNYRFENLTRLDQSLRIAADHIARLPQGSRAAISGLSAEEEIVFQADLTGAASRLETLEPVTVPEKLNRRLKAAAEAQIEDRQRVQEAAGTGGSADLFAREIYVLTDFSKTAWQDPDESGLTDTLARLDWLHVYLVDVSVASPSNKSLSNLTLSDQTAVAGRDLILTMTVSTTGEISGATTVETFLVDSSGIETRSGAPRIVQTDKAATQIQAAVRITGGESFVNGLVRLTTEDPLQDDNVRFFSCDIRPRPRLLLVSDRGAGGETEYLRYALQPEESEQSGLRYCDITEISSAQFRQQSLSDFDIVCVMNCQRPDESFWTSLKGFAAGGGSVIVVAGSNRIQAGAWNAPAARDLLPAVPIRVVRFLNEPGRLQLQNEQHPLVREFVNDEGSRVELSVVAFERCWAAEAAPDASVVLSFSGSGNRPALLERRVGQGRCLLFTSAMDNLTNGGSEWNNLVNSWSFLLLTEEMVKYCTGASNLRRNFLAGEAINLPVPASQRFEVFLLRRPGLRQTRGLLPADQSSILLTDAVDPGHYRVKPFESASGFSAAFAVNVRDEESDLTRITDEVLQGMLPAEHTTIVHNPDDLQRVVRAGRLGVEVFPALMGLLVLLVCGEHLMANYFYEEVPASQTNRPGSNPR